MRARRDLAVLPVLAAADRRSRRRDRNATLLVTVVDETRGVLPGATVTLAGIEPANKAAAIAPAATSPQGQAKFENLAPGRYSITAEFSGLPDAHAARRPDPQRREPAGR